jgi:hypothetical protein
MKKFSFIMVVIFISIGVFSQKVDSIFFHLYTDSLKKGQHNYINVDGKLSNGHWLPLTSKEIQFSSSAGRFEGNDLVIPTVMVEEKIEVKAILKSDTSMWRDTTIWIKKIPDPEHLPGLDDMIKQNPSKKKQPSSLPRHG